MTICAASSTRNKPAAPLRNKNKQTNSKPKVVDAQNALTAEVLAQCETRGRFKQLFTDLYK